MAVLGTGILKGLGVTLKHFVNSYVEEFKYIGRKAGVEPRPLRRQSPKNRGLVTVEYPERAPADAGELPLHPVPGAGHRQRRGQVHVMRHLRQGLPAPVHLDRAHQRPGHQAPRAAAQGVLHRHDDLHELRLLRRVLPVRRDQDGHQLRVVGLRAHQGDGLRQGAPPHAGHVPRLDPSHRLVARAGGQGGRGREEAPGRGSQGQGRGGQGGGSGRRCRRCRRCYAKPAAGAPPAAKPPAPAAKPETPPPAQPPAEGGAA